MSHCYSSSTRFVFLGHFPGMYDSLRLNIGLNGRSLDVWLTWDQCIAFMYISTQRYSISHVVLRTVTCRYHCLGMILLLKFVRAWHMAAICHARLYARLGHTLRYMLELAISLKPGSLIGICCMRLPQAVFTIFPVTCICYMWTGLWWCSAGCFYSYI